jgi:pseudaminic acid biosynthesis-associated methylase
MKCDREKLETPPKSTDEASRLEELWNSDFGDSYVDRNRGAGEKRGQFWDEILTRFSVQSVLEVGCNVGTNLRWLVSHLSPKNVYGIDINIKALREVRHEFPEVNTLWGPARELPFRDRWFDLVFTTGVLIHQPESTLPLVMGEIVRCARRYVMCGEYYAEEVTEIFYRGQKRALFKRNYGRMYEELFPGLHLCKQGFLSREEGWDDITYWVFEK